MARMSYQDFTCGYFPVNEFLLREIDSLIADSGSCNDKAVFILKSLRSGYFDRSVMSDKEVTNG